MWHPELGDSQWIIGEGNGVPRQYCCLKNPMDGGAWWAAVHGVAKNDWATSLSFFAFMNWRRKWQPTPMFLPGESQGQGSLVGCRLWGHTESDTTEVLAPAPVIYIVRARLHLLTGSFILKLKYTNIVHLPFTSKEFVISWYLFWEQMITQHELLQ